MRRQVEAYYRHNGPVTYGMACFSQSSRTCGAILAQRLPGKSGKAWFSIS
ncbi:hypothetical protein ABZZ47_22165 [Streptomyces sp. NPDC006465]